MKFDPFKDSSDRTEQHFADPTDHFYGLMRPVTEPIHRQIGHAPEVGPHDIWKGKTWEDMPSQGKDSTHKRLNFALFRRGLYDPTAGREVFRLRPCGSAI